MKVNTVMLHLDFADYLISFRTTAGFSCVTSYGSPLGLLTFAWIQLCQLPGLTTRRFSPC